MKYPSDIHKLELAGRQVRFLEIRNPEALFDNLLSQGLEHDDVKDERIPYWAELWPSAIGLATHILQGPSLKGRNVLEIGCGLGLPSIAAGLSGADVTFTDYLEEALDSARANWKLNMDRDADFRLLDWRHPSKEDSTDFLLASDVAYEQRSFLPLVEFFKTTVQPGGTILLSEPGRKYAQAWIGQLASAGFPGRRFVYPVTRWGVLTQVNVYELTASR